MSFLLTGAGGEIPIYASFAQFPASAKDGAQALAADTNTVYVYDTSVPGWVVVATAGADVSAVTASAPLASSGGTTPNITISQASALSDGYLSSTDWSTFNGKQNALTFGNLTEATSSVLTISGGTGSVIGSGTSIQVKQSSAVQSGYLSSTDWSTFNGKMTNPMTTAGDIIVGGASGTPARLALGTVDKVLVSDGTTVSYQYAGLGGGSLGTNNIVLGRAKPASLAGTNNFIAGTSAGNALSSGIKNILIGVSAGAALTTVSNNVAIGDSALSTSTSAGNVAVGFEAGKPAGIQNVFIGEAAGTDATGLRNVVIGNYAGYALRGGDGNVIIGKDAAFFNLSTGTNNICIGRMADTTAGGTSSAIVLGGYGKAGNNEFAVGSSTVQINTMYLGRGGETQTSANAVKIMSMKGTGTNTDLSAGTMTIAGSQSTGSAAGSSVYIATASAGSSGTTLNSHTNRLEVTATNNGDVKVLTGNLMVATAGKGLQIKGGSNASIGTASLSGASSVTVTTTALQGLTTPVIFLTGQDGNDAFAVNNINTTAGTFDIVHSGNITATVAWMIIETA